MNNIHICICSRLRVQILYLIVFVQKKMICFTPNSVKKILHRGDIESLDRCGEQHRYHSSVDQEYTETKKNLKTEKIIQNGKTQKPVEICQNYRYSLRPGVHREAWFPPCFVRQNQQKINFFLRGDFRPLPNKMFNFETTSFQRFSPRFPNL